jgi:hypothetical protein
MRRRYPDKPLVLAVNKCESPTLGPSGSVSTTTAE